MESRIQVARYRATRTLARGLRFLPESLRFRGRVAGLPQSQIPPTPVRLFVGPTNSAGQGWQWAHATRSPDVGGIAMSVGHEGGFDFLVDQSVPLAAYRWSRRWAREQERVVSAGFTHVLLESGRPLFGDTIGGTPLSQARRLNGHGVRVALVFHGSDIRSPSRHAAEHAWSPYRPGEWSLTPVLELRAAENASLAAALDGPTFVSTLDLLDDLPGATWLPVIVDAAAWRTAAPPFRDGTPVVAHAPSSGVVKGSELIDPVLRALEEEGLIRYRRVTGVPASEMPGVYRDVDIVLDQFRLGSYGVAACEAMAAGRLVLSHVTPAVRARVLEATGRELPIVQADPSTLETVLRAVVADPAAFRAAAEAGPAFVEHAHGRDAAARVLAPFLRG